MLELGGGGVPWDKDSEVSQQSGTPKPTGGYQPNMIMEPHSPTTPWNTLHPIKQEVTEEARNDSGITSGSSDSHSSPGSENSLEYNAQNFPVSLTHQNYAQNAISYYSTPITPRTPFTYQNPHLIPTIEMESPTKQPQKQSKSENGNGGSSLEMPLAASTLRVESKDKQEEVDPLRRLEMSLEKNGLLSSLSPKTSEASVDGDNRSEIDFDEYDEQGLRVPKVNSHGKVKTFRCKQCDFISITKMDFWEHSKAHINSAKLLTCPKCPFVTEYKHHLEYHLRNHFGSKPFKCNECPYTCVNKSMLNSHLKSHSNVYQFRCADCNYATKYCHSLKLHLRKYAHKPGPVLNADGTVNPLPIIDVYGTRRGPKQKLMRKQEVVEDNSNSQMFQNSLTQIMLNASPQLRLPFPYPFFAGALTNPLLFPPNFAQLVQGTVGDGTANTTESRPYTPEDLAPSNPGALDLTMQDISESPAKKKPQVRNRRKGIAQHRIINKEESDEEDEHDNVDIAEDNAFGQHAKEDITRLNKARDECGADSSNGEKMEIEPTNNNVPDNFSCQFCNIAFGDVILYTMHMGYHGYKNPFACNMCGEQCTDKISFFLHIARTSHS